MIKFIPNINWCCIVNIKIVIMNFIKNTPSKYKILNVTIKYFICIHSKSTLDKSGYSHSTIKFSKGKSPNKIEEGLKIANLIVTNLKKNSNMLFFIYSLKPYYFKTFMQFYGIFVASKKLRELPQNMPSPYCIFVTLIS